MAQVTKADLRNMKQITVEDYMDGAGIGQPVYIDTFGGPKLVTGLNGMFGYPSVFCGRDNAGFGMSYAAALSTPLYVSNA